MYVHPGQIKFIKLVEESLEVMGLIYLRNEYCVGPILQRKGLKNMEIVYYEQKSFLEELLTLFNRSTYHGIIFNKGKHG